MGEQFILKRDEGNKNNGYLNHWKQNLSKEDILAIYKSRGVIGLSLDKSVLCGNKALKEIDETFEGTKQRRQALMQALMANILTAIKTIGKEDAWSIISIGSNFDDMLQPMSTYSSAI